MGQRKFSAYTILFGWYLIGWYLMIPPTDAGAPLSQWIRAATYNTAGECKAKRYANISQASKIPGNHAAAVEKARKSKCVPAEALNAR